MVDARFQNLCPERRSPRPTLGSHIVVRCRRSQEGVVVVMAPSHTDATESIRRHANSSNCGEGAGHGNDRMSNSPAAFRYVRSCVRHPYLHARADGRSAATTRRTEAIVGRNVTAVAARLRYARKRLFTTEYLTRTELKSDTSAMGVAVIPR